METEEKGNLEEFKKRIASHVEHVKEVGAHCTTEETTKQALILPLLDMLGFSPYDPTKVKAEYGADFPGVKASERVDYALFTKDTPVLFIEAKAYSQSLTNHCPQLSRYYNATPDVTVAAITNGREWRFFTDLKKPNIMDPNPFLIIDFENPTDDIAEHLECFRFDQLDPTALRALAEESIYLTAFKGAITSALRDCDIDFVKYMASRAGIQRTMTSRFLDSVKPIVKQAVAQSVSAMVATSLSQADAPAALEPIEITAPDEDVPVVDPNNPKIVTTADERNLFNICADILPDEDLQPRDTESYFSIVYGGKSNRWIFRFWGDKKHPALQFIAPFTDIHRAETLRAGLQVGSGNHVLLDKPENLYRLAGIVKDSLAYCKDEENFKRKGRSDQDVTTTDIS